MSTAASASALCRTLVWIGAIGGLGCGRGGLFIVPLHPCEEDPDSCVFQRSVLPQADIVFIIDDSSSMVREQATLARSFPAFLDVLDAAALGISYRIAITNTDGHAELQMSSCRARADDFIDNYPLLDDPVVDQREKGCFSVCEHDDLAIVPTRTNRDPYLQARPWLQRHGDATNLPDDVSLAAALACAGPQGIDGHAYEKPLATLAELVTQTGIESGFLRSGALFAAVIITDETDCSWRGGRRPADTEALWTDPEQAHSGICWNAGTLCEGGPGVYTDCWAADRDRLGMPAADGESVLTPIADIVATIEDYRERKRGRGGNPDVLVAVIAGVPEGWPDAALVFRDSENPEVTSYYGIGPGCGFGTETKEDPTGLPPLRLIELAKHFDPPAHDVYSVCADDYAPALASFAEYIGRIEPLLCVDGCVADAMPYASGLQPDCDVIEHWWDEDDSPGSAPVPACRFDVPPDDEDPFASATHDICFRNHPHEPYEDGLCDESVGNLAVTIARRPDAPVRHGSNVILTCRLELPVGLPCGFPWQLDGTRPVSRG